MTLIDADELMEIIKDEVKPIPRERLAGIIGEMVYEAMKQEWNTKRGENPDEID